MLNKLAKNVVAIIGILCCLLVFLLNLLYVSRIEDTTAEIVITKLYGFFNILITGFLIIGILSTSKKIEELNLSKKIKIAILIVFLVIYTIAQICWINVRQATPAWDQGEVYSAAVKMYENKWEELKNSQYLELCPQQITIAATFSAIFNLFSNSNVRIIQYFNVISNVLTILALLLICNNLEKQYKLSKTRTLIFIGTFFTLPLLSTFVYGDLMSLPMCLFAVYFIMKYCMEKKKKYAVISALFMSIAYILRMNNLIFIIALVIYLILNILEKDENKTAKPIFKKIIILVMFVAISILPATIIRNNIQSKLELEKDKQIPTLGYLYIGMEESYRANGWYSDYMSWAWNDVEASKEQYKEAIVQRTKYLIQNPEYSIKFYAKKIASMWTENTYAGLWYNQTFNFKEIDNLEDNNKSQQIDELVIDKTERLLIYQKAIVIIIFGASILTIIKNRKNLSNEIILIITIFIGGFLFHILWEAKSRYIIPYLLILIPIASISIDNFDYKRELIKMKEYILKLKKKFLTKDIMLYVIFGILTTIVNLVTFGVLESILNWEENISNFIAIIIAILFSYVTNKIWVFHSKAKGFKENFHEFFKFIGGRTTTMIIEFFGCLILFKTPIPAIISKCAISVVVISLNYLISKFYTFKNNK